MSVNQAMSAGSQPTGQVHPRSLALLAREGIATTGYHSKSWNQLPLLPDIVVTVCASAAGARRVAERSEALQGGTRPYRGTLAVNLISGLTDRLGRVPDIRG